MPDERLGTLRTIVYFLLFAVIVAIALFRSSKVF